MRRARAKAPLSASRARRQAPAPLPAAGDLLLPAEQAAWLRVSLRGLYRLVETDPTFPPAIPITSLRSIRRRTDLEQWVASRAEQAAQAKGATA